MKEKNIHAEDPRYNWHKSDEYLRYLRGSFLLQQSSKASNTFTVDFSITSGGNTMSF